MDERLNIITLGVEDVPHARAFYEQLGWEVAFTDGDIVMFQAGPMIVSLWSVAKPDPDGHTWEIAWIKALTRQPDGSVSLAS